MIDLAPQVLLAAQAAASSSDDGVNGFAFLFLLAGFLFYGLVFMRYRNVTQRHRHETETKSQIADVQAADEFSRSLTGLSNSRMHGANNHQVTGALNRLF